MSAPRKHHLVPQMYLRVFARKGKHGLVLDRATGNGGLRSVRDIFARRDWNTILDADGSPSYDVERLLAEHVEDAAAPALSSCRYGRFPLGEGARDGLALFMAAQLTRGRSARAGLTKSLSEVMRMSLALAAQNYTDAHWQRAIGEVPPPDTVERLAQGAKNLDIKPTNALLLRTLLEPVDEVAGFVWQRTWTLVEFDRPCLFTAENPVIHLNPHGDSSGYGVATAEQMYMPISPERGLLLSHPWTSWPGAAVAGTTQLAEKLNWAMLTYPSNAEVLLHPDVPAHPLPGAALLASGSAWPWGPDPEAAPPVFMHYVSAGARSKRDH